MLVFRRRERERCGENDKDGVSVREEREYGFFEGEKLQKPHNKA